MSRVKNNVCLYLSHKLALRGILALTLVALSAAQKSGRTTLSSEFANPPLAARPQVRFWTSAAAVTSLSMSNTRHRTAQCENCRQTLTLLIL